MLFQRIIRDWKSWGEVFCDLPSFEPLCREILKREGLAEDADLTGLTPGTNAVFRAGGLVLKIYVPAESGMDSQRDYETEKAVSERLAGLDIRTPRLVCAGEIRDAYLFRYLIMEYMPGEEAGRVFARWQSKQRQAFAEELAGVLRRLHQPFAQLPAINCLQRAGGNPRLQQLPQPMRRSFCRRLERIRPFYAGVDPVLVHGDLTGENVLIRPDGSFGLIDFADARTAPDVYEWPPLVFELLRCDPAAVGVLAGGRIAGFVRELLDGLVMHDFGPDLVMTWQERCGKQFRDLEELEKSLNDLWAPQDRKENDNA